MSTQADSFSRLSRRLGWLLAIVVLPALITIAFAWMWLADAKGGTPQYWPYVLVGLIASILLFALIAFAVMQRSILRPLRTLSQQMEAIAMGDLTQRINPAAAGDFSPVFVSMRRLQDNLNRLVHGVRTGLNGIAAGTHELIAGNADLSRRTEAQTSALQQSVVSMEELAATVKQNADNARQANQLATMASEVAHRGGKAVGEVVSTMNGISDSSRKISDIVGVIDSIAFQTNILALNAAVEAARAGEQGKGFAVVASEVRALAQRSAQAAKEIKALIEDSVRKVSEGSGQVETAGATMQEIVEAVARVTDIMGEISAATSEQATGIEEINRAIASMDEMTRGNASMVQQESLAISRLDQEVVQVSQAVSSFRLQNGSVIDVAAATLESSRVKKGLPDNAAASTASARNASASSTTAYGQDNANRLASSGKTSNGQRQTQASSGKSASHTLSSNKSQMTSDEDDWVEF